ncbi:hypothetical protein M3G03_04710 [Aestuariimicrobium sp. p3-SID1156]|uniref:hypothetical protein n=1 Tax=Aestuariimicrobium sp. p3-SID1156 TaxID=2916038 RepID=UPI00223BCBF5|nr:hypothetical protein [Aestuariimicrobium sp. p3-SID1156]MCT1458844.1 hypothetical protein [Aestuariimicrobium sp. p3-SID1156]
MRTTITLDSDVEALLEREMAARQLPFKQVVNDALRRGLGASRGADFTFPSYSMGVPRVDLTHALRLAASMEDEALLTKMAEGR